MPRRVLPCLTLSRQACAAAPAEHPRRRPSGPSVRPARQLRCSMAAKRRRHDMTASEAEQSNTLRVCTFRQSFGKSPHTTLSSRCYTHAPPGSILAAMLRRAAQLLLSAPALGAAALSAVARGLDGAHAPAAHEREANKCRRTAAVPPPWLLLFSPPVCTRIL